MEHADGPRTSPVELTRMLSMLGAGNPIVLDQLFSVIYTELRAMAQEALNGERSNHTLQATALVHEVYLKLIDQTTAKWHNRAQFFAIAAQAMRRLLVDHARKKKREKRGGDRQQLSLSCVEPLAQERTIEVVALDEAMTRLASEEPLEAQIVEMRYFAGLEVQEIAHVLGITTRTVQRRWNFAKAWLHRELAKDEEDLTGNHAP